LEANPFYFELEDESGAASDEERIEEQLGVLYSQLVSREYPISADSTALAVRFYPSAVQTDIAFIRSAYRDLEALVDSLQPATYHPQMEVTMAGLLMRQMIEVDMILDDVVGSFGAGVLTLLLMVVLYFFYKGYQARAGRHFSRRVLLSELARMPVTALVIGVPLLTSLAWTFGITYLTLGVLNMMTSTLGLVLFGLGIDFGIHFYARYTEERGEGRSVEAAAERTFMTTGQAITGVGLTTAAAFFILMLADFRGFSEFGFIAGVGLLFAIVTMTLMLPALVVLFERAGLLRLAALPAAQQPPAEDPSAGGRFPAPRWVLAASLVAVGGALWAAPQVQFEYDFGELSPRYEEYAWRSAKARQVYSDRPTRNAAYILADSAEAVPNIVEALRAHMKADTLTPTIRAVESLQDRFPLDTAAQQAKLDQIAAIRTLLNDPFLRGETSEDLQRLRRAAGVRTPPSLDDVPDFLKERFTTKTGEVGHLVIIYPSVGLSDGRLSMQFADDVGTVRTADGDVYHAGSTSIVASDMLRLMVDEAPLMVGLTVLFIVVFKLIILHRVRWVVLALLPLAASFLWMFALMPMLGLKLNFYNLVVLPTVLGIGDDSGIHVVHRYLEEGRGSVRRVLRSTGEHIAMSACTTMVGFGGLLLSMYPGLRSIGELAVLGIALTLVAALVVLPALLQWMEDRSATEEASAAGEPSVPEPA
ncbi:MAG: MMPL family transporter, partial [Bacteroidetes bacterium]|nr:MMPL family transporter [Bacteroidota bacterium]